MGIRRVVTGFDKHGIGRFVADEQLGELQNSNTTLSSVWRTNGAGLQIPPLNDIEDGFGFPAPGGCWVLAWTVPPYCIAGEDGARGTDPTEVGGLPSGGAHSTDSVDVNFILFGKLVFQLGDGSETMLDSGDSIVVNGISRTWHNRTDEPATVLSVINGAKRVRA
ncbi:cupin domain-containing protein [Rhodococcus qingshengii]|uniref:cupin domain-containing protein n=1 Tax=Rhodococcus qingshengii TaxID=334542 RepID=UPI0010A5F685|nr:cupin domain-containing protein [Rhodococcus qingshengii]THJ67702.1 cupin domain-containing protein [Rhodococcus qingshengii]